MDEHPSATAKRPTTRTYRNRKYHTAMETLTPSNTIHPHRMDSKGKLRATMVVKIRDTLVDNRPAPKCSLLSLCMAQELHISHRLDLLRTSIRQETCRFSKWSSMRSPNMWQNVSRAHFCIHCENQQTADWLGIRGAMFRTNEKRWAGVVNTKWTLGHSRLGWLLVRKLHSCMATSVYSQHSSSQSH